MRKARRLRRRPEASRRGTFLSFPPGKSRLAGDGEERAAEGEINSDPDQQPLEVKHLLEEEVWRGMQPQLVQGIGTGVDVLPQPRQHHQRHQERYERSHVGDLEVRVLQLALELASRVAANVARLLVLPAPEETVLR